MVDHVEVKDNYVIILKYFRGSNINQLIKSYQSYKFYGILRHHHVLLLNNEVKKVWQLFTIQWSFKDANCNVYL